MIPVEKYLADERARGEYSVSYDYQKRIERGVVDEFNNRVTKNNI